MGKLRDLGWHVAREVLSIVGGGRMVAGAIQRTGNFLGQAAASISNALNRVGLGWPAKIHGMLSAFLLDATNSAANFFTKVSDDVIAGNETWGLKIVNGAKSIFRNLTGGVDAAQQATGQAVQQEQTSFVGKIKGAIGKIFGGLKAAYDYLWLPGEVKTLMGQRKKLPRFNNPISDLGISQSRWIAQQKEAEMKGMSESDLLAMRQQ